ncbi:MAG: hypothetical protein FWG19_04330, partial [Methanomassiliicoccaceae archaeon]|nr:hypothetical protein [Methanomassiliicoccaceae archaeon]
RVIFALYLGAWLWVASHGGVFTMTLPDPGTISASISSMELSLDVTYIVYVLIIICIARMFLAFAELGGHRKKYLEALEKKKDTMSRRKARRLSSGK